MDDTGTGTLVIFLILWIGSGLIGVAINAAKGKSKVWGFLGGAFFGLFGWIFLAIHGGGQTFTCATCREQVRAGALACRHCGTRFTTPAGTAV